MSGQAATLSGPDRPEKPRERRSYSVPAAEKALDIIEYMAGLSQGLTATELAAGLGRSVHEIYRVIQSLETRGFLFRPPGGDRYRLSLRLFELAHQMPAVRQLSDAALPIMQALTPSTQQSCHLAVLSGREALIVLQIDSPLPMRYSVMLGAKFPFEETSSGVVIYAYSSERTRTALDETLRGDGQSEAMIASVHERAAKVTTAGFERAKSLSVGGVTNIAVPIFDRLGHAAAALTVPFIPQSAARVAIEDVTKLTVQAGRAISAELGAGNDLVPEGGTAARADQDTTLRS